jgi:hypothetical protein
MDITTLIEKVGPQAPTLVVGLLIVWLFLKELRAMHRDDNQARRLDREVLEKMSASLHTLSQSNMQLAARIEMLDTRWRHDEERIRND